MTGVDQCWASQRVLQSNNYGIDISVYWYKWNSKNKEHFWTFVCVIALLLLNLFLCGHLYFLCVWFSVSIFPSIYTNMSAGVQAISLTVTVYFSVIVPGCLSVYVLTCLPFCVPACLSLYQIAGLYANLSVCVWSILWVCWLVQSGYITGCGLYLFTLMFVSCTSLLATCACWLATSSTSLVDLCFVTLLISYTSFPCGSWHSLDLLHVFCLCFVMTLLILWKNTRF